MSALSKRVVFVLGGPGSGKGTVCSRVVRALPAWTTLSAGELIRAEAASASADAKRITEILAEGRIIPSEITVRRAPSQGGARSARP